MTRTTEATAQPLDPPPSSQVEAPDTPPPNQPPVSHKKGGRPPNARKGKLGKNQYTRDRDIQDENQSPHRSQSRDVARTDEGSHNSGIKASASEGKPGKSKGINSKIAMTDMKKRVTGILDFISRTQLELAGESMSPTAGEAAHKLIRGIADGLPTIKVNGDNSKAGNAGDGDAAKEFKDLSCLEMMDVLTRQLVKWQNEFA